MDADIMEDLKNIITKEDLSEPYILLADFLPIEDIIKIEKQFSGCQFMFKKMPKNVEQEQPELWHCWDTKKLLKWQKFLVV